CARRPPARRHHHPACRSVGGPGGSRGDGRTRRDRDTARPRRGTAPSRARPRPLMRYDRDEILARVDLPALCEETLGPPKGRGRSATWPCPAPRHGTQTGKTPPVSIFTTRYGEQRWRCHACGAGGTAIDLVMVTQGLGFRDAIEVLAQRTGVAASMHPGELRRAHVERPQPLEPGQVRPE